MASLTNTRLKNRARQRGVAAVLLTSLLLVAAVCYSTAKPESTPVEMNACPGQNLAASASPADHPAAAFGDKNQPPVAANSTLAPFLNIVPSGDGTELWISAGRVGELGGTVFANIGIGPGHYIGSWTMSYSDTIQSYVVTAVGFTPNMDDYAPLSITSTLGLDSGTVNFNRAYVPASTSRSIDSMDGALRLTLVSTDTLPTEAYVVVVPSYAPPGLPPLGHRLVGSAYSVRASGTLLVSDRPMSLRLYYDEATLTGADPHTLAIFAWDAHNKRWDELGGWLFQDTPEGDYVSVTTSRFTTYALMTTPTWRDDFWDATGLEDNSGVTVGGSEVRLASDQTSGWAVSKPITPTTSFESWASLVFTATVPSLATTLTVDLLTPDGSAVLTDVTSGADLTALEASGYPALKLRANFSSTAVGRTPVLHEWRLTWRVEEHKVHLPLVLKGSG